MVVDCLRSFHVVPCRFREDSDELAWVRWYPCAPGAKPLPFPSAFGSAIWESRTLWDNSDLGMRFPIPPGSAKDPAPYHWRRAAFPAPPGQHWHGPVEWFQRGVPADAPREYRRDWCGRPLMERPAEAVPSARGTMIGYRRHPVDFTLDKVTPTIVSTQQDDYPLPSGGAFRLSSTVPVVFTGFANGFNSRVVVIENVGAAFFQIANQSSSSLAQNRVCCLDGIATRVWPGYSAWLQYDGISQCWRELQNVPLIQTKGDLITATDSGPSVLHAGPLPGAVLTQDEDEPTGLLWTPLTQGRQVTSEENRDVGVLYEDLEDYELVLAEGEYILYAVVRATISAASGSYIACRIRDVTHGLDCGPGNVYVTMLQTSREGHEQSVGWMTRFVCTDTPTVITLQARHQIISAMDDAYVIVGQDTILGAMVVKGTLLP